MYLERSLLMVNRSRTLLLFTALEVEMTKGCNKIHLTSP